MVKIENKHDVPCSVEGCNSLQIYRKGDWLCGYHLQIEYHKNSKQGTKNWFKSNRKPIRKVSAKRAIESKVYSRTRIEFLSRPENRTCFIDGCPAPADTIEHTAGRIGSLYLNQEYWKPCCFKHNLELENNPELSKKYQVSRLHQNKRL